MTRRAPHALPTRTTYTTMTTTMGRMMTNMTTMTMRNTPRACLRCEHQWTQRGETLPQQCPRCKSPLWNVARGRVAAADKLSAAIPKIAAAARGPINLQTASTLERTIERDDYAQE